MKSFQPKYFLSADYHYVKEPLVVINTTTNTRVATLINSRAYHRLLPRLFLPP